MIQITANGKNGQWIRVLKRHDPKLSREFGKLATPFGTSRGFLAGEVNLVVSLSRDASAKFPCPNRSYSAAKSFRYMYRIRSQSTRRPQAAISRACEAVRGQVEVPAGGQEKSPLPLLGLRLVQGRSPRLCWAWRMRNDSPSVMTTLAWCNSRSRMLAAVVCSGRNRPHDSKGQWLAMPSERRS